MPASQPHVAVPMWARLELGHAVVEHLARRDRVDLLHIKGPATEALLRAEGRSSSDVDVLVRPAHVDVFMQTLENAGFDTRTHFETGSIFRHAANLHHPNWGWVDVHRSFPGIDVSPGEAFDRLWARRSTARVAAYDLPVPSLLDQAALLVLHGARDNARGRADVEHVEGALSATQWNGVVAVSRELKAEVAFAAGTGDLERFRDRPEHDLWKVASEGGTRLQEWRARVRAARTTGEKARLVVEAFSTNSDHLRMELGHEPSRGERMSAEARRPLVAIGELKSALVRRRGRTRR